MTLTEILQKTGHTTCHRSTFAEPVTREGDHQAENGFFYHVTWDGGQLVTSPVGYSAPFKKAEQEFETLYGAVSDENHAEFERFIRKRLEL